MINLNILTSRREHFLPLQFYFLKRIKPENRSKIMVSILAYGDMRRFIPTIDSFSANGIRSRAVSFTSEYLEKSNWAVTQPQKYSAKIDEDVFIDEHTWDFIIENIEYLDEHPEVTAITPILSNGIPTCDMFLKSVFDETDRKYIEQIFLETRFSPDLWGLNYDFLNKHTRDAKEWDSEAFYASVAEWGRHYQGIHPVRVSPAAQMEINNMIMEKYYPKIFNTSGHSLRQVDYPYLCNNMFFIRTDKWKKIIQDPSLYVDPFDEVPLSRYKQRNGEKWAVIDGSAGVHTIYNTVYGHPGIQHFENTIVEELRKKL